jgi:FtsH-binding integral membrane protein
MKRFLIFTVMYPALVLLVFITADPSSRRTFPETWSLSLGIAYLFALIPAWVSAAVDWKLSAKPIYLRLFGTAVTGAVAVMAALVSLHFEEILSDYAGFLIVALIGAIPAAVCSWLSSEKQNGTVG